MRYMLELHEFDRNFPDGVLLALAITGGAEPDDQRHTGFVVRDFNDQLHLFHLGSHNNFSHQPLRKQYNYLLIPFLEPATANAVIALLFQLFHETNGQVSYSVAWDDEDYFDANGALIKTAALDGFTCATFVLEILRRHGFDLIDRETWPKTAKDSEWQRHILKVLHLPLENLMAQLEVIGQYPRVRPEQALGAAHIYTGSVLPFGAVYPAALEVVREMDRIAGA